MLDFKYDRKYLFGRFSSQVKSVFTVSCIVVLLLGMLVSTQTAFASGLSTKPSPTNTMKGKPHNIKPFNLSGQQSEGTPSGVSYGSSLYAGWTGTNNRINMTYSSANCAIDSCFNNPVTTFTDSSVYGEGVSLAGYTPPGGSSHVWIAFTGGDHLIHFGYFNGSNVLQSGHYVPNQSSCHQPSIAGYNGRLWIAWVGTDLGNCTGHLNIISTTDGTSYSSKTVFTGDSSNVGPSITAYAGYLYLNFTGTNEIVYARQFNGSSMGARGDSGLRTLDNLVTGSANSGGTFWGAAINPSNTERVYFNGTKNPPSFPPPGSGNYVQFANPLLYGVALADFQGTLQLLWVDAFQTLNINRLQ